MTSRLARCLALGAAASTVFAATVCAATERIAFVGALTGEHAAIGRDQRDGFLLALAQQHGSLGGTSVRVTEFDDRGEAQRTSVIAGQILAARIPIVTGVTTGESALALSSKLAGKAIVLSSGAGPAALAGEKCARSFFSTAPVQDAVHENAGAIAQKRRYQSLYVVTSPAALPSVRKALQRKFAGSLSGAGPASDALRGIRAAPPDAVYVALPAKEIRAFLVSYEKTGLFQRIPVIAADDGFLPAELHNQFAGLIVSTRWSAGMEDERSKRFVAEFQQHYGRRPSSYAMQGYDAALVLGGALQALKTDAPSAAAIGRALATRKADGVAGPIRFAANHFPITQWYAWETFDDSSGSIYLAPLEPTLREYVDPYSERCKLNHEGE